MTQLAPTTDGHTYHLYAHIFPGHPDPLTLITDTVHNDLGDRPILTYYIESWSRAVKELSYWTAMHGHLLKHAANPSVTIMKAHRRRRYQSFLDRNFYPFPG